MPICFTQPLVTQSQSSTQISQMALWLNYPFSSMLTQGQCRYNKSRYFNCMSWSTYLTYLWTDSCLVLYIFEAINSSYRLTRPSLITVFMALPKGISLLQRRAVSICLQQPNCRPLRRSQVRVDSLSIPDVPRPINGKICLFGNVSKGGPFFFFTYYSAITICYIFNLQNQQMYHMYNLIQNTRYQNTDDFLI